MNDSSAGNAGSVDSIIPGPKDPGGLTSAPKSSGLPPKRHSPFLVVPLCFLVIIGVVTAILVFRQPARPTGVQFDRDGVPIIEFNKRQVIERVAASDSQPLNEPEARGIFRWAVGHPDEAAKLSAEEKAGIIKSLNE